MISDDATERSIIDSGSNLVTGIFRLLATFNMLRHGAFSLLHMTNAINLLTV